MFALIIVVALGAAWLLSSPGGREEAETPAPAPEPQPPPPKVTPEPSPVMPPTDPPPEPRHPPVITTPEPTAPPKYGDGDLVIARDGRRGPATVSHWDKYVPAWYYQVGGSATRYQEAELSATAPPKLTDWPLNNTGQPRVRAMDPQGRLVLITEAEAASHVNSPGWSLHGLVMPEPSETDLRRVVEVNTITSTPLGPTGVDWLAGQRGFSSRSQYSYSVGPHHFVNTWGLAAAIVARERGYSTLTAWAAVNPDALANTRNQINPHPIPRIQALHDQLELELAQRATTFNRAMDERIRLINKYEMSWDRLLDLARERGITA